MSKFKLEHDETTLLIIDLQEKLLPAMKDKEKILRNSQILLSLAKEFDFPVIVTEQYPKGLGVTVTEIQSVLPEAHYLIEKVSFSAWDQPLQDAFKKIGTGKSRTLLVAGVESHVCVFQTVRDLLERGYNIHVVSDAVGSRFEENYQNGINLMQNMGAIITDTETAVFDCLVKAGGQSFKNLSAQIK
ncbi:MAG: hydrolase [Syntrophomonadaceae bacterium]|jgi:nicotinamidase-related amidase|nr:hydrolase [Syntrophomonadaceae bacterium]